MGATLHGVRVADVMTAHPVAADPNRTVAEFIDAVALSHPYSSYPLANPEGRLLGLVTLNRIRALPATDRVHRRLIDIACPAAEVTVARPDEPLVDLLPRLAGCADGRAVVVDAQERLVGIVSPRDVSNYLAVADLRTAQRPYPLAGADLSGGGHPGRR
jgi:CBS domain-containing protein